MGVGGKMTAEYIEREAAIDALQNHYEVRNAVQNGIMDECVMLMMRVPAADVVPVVRCGECAYCEWKNEVCTYGWCKRNCAFKMRHEYCSDGVKREAEHG